MMFPIFNKYFSFNAIIYIILSELLLIIPIIIFYIFPTTFWFFVFLIFSFLECLIHLYLIPMLILFIPIEFYLRKTGRIIKANVVNIPVKFQKYIYIIAALIYITITIIGIVVGQPMTEEELRYD